MNEASGPQTVFGEITWRVGSRIIRCYLANLCRLLGLPEFFGF
jgi:hypothetical protein